MTLAAPQSHTFVDPHPLECELGGELPILELAYTTWGQLAPDGGNVVWVMHPLTCNANPQAWWPALVGPGRSIDPQRHFVICANSLGSCYGSSGPTSTNPRTGTQYGREFPLITLRDVIVAFERLREHLGIDRIHLGIGGSYGGQQLLEWMATRPALFEQACVVGADLRQTPWAVALNETQRMALEADPGFASGRAGAGTRGLAAARALAMLSYRSPRAYRVKQSEADDAVAAGHRAASYQRHVGNRFTERFDPLAYWTLTRAMDSHNPARGRSSLREAFAAVAAHTLFIALEDDQLFPPAEIAASLADFPGAELVTIASEYGHDGILAHGDEIARVLARFLERNELVSRPPSWSRTASCRV
ncbi:homoserine O-acetyltransferase [Arenimonas soli]|uniref:Homoserine O-acetyltransferase n=1 Tax=Arenimonas soli TaxID=2269504 RepID=A0ABQ1HMV6_9GAMM|nr:homoserine O-acetyltransferase [Arenimonas soli]GGA81863.1 homoserine O-acetyltransferase [Arenimonas soli]